MLFVGFFLSTYKYFLNFKMSNYERYVKLYSKQFLEKGWFSGNRF